MGDFRSQLQMCRYDGMMTYYSCIDRKHGHAHNTSTQNKQHILYAKDGWCAMYSAEGAVSNDGPLGPSRSFPLNLPAELENDGRKLNQVALKLDPTITSF